MINSNVLVIILCRKDKTNQQNEDPLHLSIMLNRQRKLISLKESINIESWDFKLNHAKPNYPNKEYLELKTNEAKQKTDKTALSFKLTNKSFAIDDLAPQKVNSKTPNNNLATT